MRLNMERIYLLVIVVLTFFSGWFAYQYFELSDQYDAKVYELRSKIIEEHDKLNKAEATIGILKNQLRGTE